MDFQKDAGHNEKHNFPDHICQNLQRLFSSVEKIVMDSSSRKVFALIHWEDVFFYVLDTTRILHPKKEINSYMLKGSALTRNTRRKHTQQSFVN